MPLQKLAVWPVSSPRRNFDNLTRFGVELLALDDIGGEPRRRRRSEVFGEEPGIADEYTADLRVLARRDRVVAGDLSPQFRQARGAAARAQQFPGVRYPHRHEAAE